MQDTLISGMVGDTMKNDQSKIFLETRTREIDFSSIYQRYATPIYRYTIARVGNRADAEDLTSLVFMDALKSWKRFKVNGNIPAWLFTIARNKIVDCYRREKETIPLEFISDTIVEEKFFASIRATRTAPASFRWGAYIQPNRRSGRKVRSSGKNVHAPLA